MLYYFFDFFHSKNSIFLYCLMLAFLLSCSPKTTNIKTPLTVPNEFSKTGDEEIIDNWWENFNDPQLNNLMQKSLDTNFNLLAAWHRFKASQYVVNRENSQLLPDLEAFFQGAARFPEPDFVGGENLQIGLSASYEIDLWGRIKAQVDAERFRSSASFADYRAAGLSLSGQLATSYYQWVATEQQLRLLETQLENNEKILSLIKARFGSGQIRGVDLLRQQQLISATKEQAMVLEGQAAVLKNQVAVLCGMAPTNFKAELTDELPGLPSFPSTGIPGELIERRPDVRSSYFILQSADRELAAAISARYPRFTLSGNLSTRTNDAGNLFRDWAYSLGGNLVAPLFYGGRLKAEKDRTEQVKQQRIYEYGQVILNAFQEVENALIQEAKQKERLVFIDEQLKSATQALEQLKMSYFNGQGDYLAVLTASNEVQQLERDKITAKQLLLEYRVSLYRSLAGGFEMGRENS